MNNLLVIIIFNLSLIDSLVIKLFTSNDTYQEVYFNSPYLPVGIDSFSFNNTELVFRDSVTGCYDNDYSDLTKDKVVYVIKTYCSFQYKAEVCKRNGCLGVVVCGLSQPAGLESYTSWDSDKPKHNLAPLVEIGSSDCINFLNLIHTALQYNSTQTILVDMNSEDINYYKEVFKSGGFIFMYYIVLPLFSLINLSLAIRNIYQLVRAGRFTFILKYINIVELIINSFQFLVIIIDPLYSNLIFPGLVQRFALTWANYWSLTCNLAIAVVWLDCLIRIKYVTKLSLTVKYRRYLVILFISISVIVLLTDFIDSIISQGVYITIGEDLLNLVLPIISNVIVLIIYFTLGFSMIYKVRKLITSEDSTFHSYVIYLKILILRIFVSGVGTLLNTISLAVVVYSYTHSAQSFVISFFFYLLGSKISSLISVLASGYTLIHSRQSDDSEKTNDIKLEDKKSQVNITHTDIASNLEEIVNV